MTTSDPVLRLLPVAAHVITVPEQVFRIGRHTGHAFAEDHARAQVAVEYGLTAREAALLPVKWGSTRNAAGHQLLTVGPLSTLRTGERYP